MLKAFRKDGEKGFTLIELMIVIAIIGILAAIAVPQLITYRTRGWVTAVQDDVNRAGAEVASWQTDPANAGALPPAETIVAAALGTKGVTYTGFRTTAEVGIDIAAGGCPITGTHTNLNGSYIKDCDGLVTNTLAAK